MKYKNFGSSTSVAVAASHSNASSNGGNGGGYQSQPHSQHSIRTTTTTHRSSDRKSATSSTDAPPVSSSHHHHYNNRNNSINDDEYYDEEELISTTNTTDSHSVKGTLQRLQQQHHHSEEDLEDASADAAENASEYEDGDDDQHRQDSCWEEDYRLAEEREPSANSRNSRGHFSDAGSSWNTTQTPNTASSSRRATKLAYVAYVPMNENTSSSSHHQATMATTQQPMAAQATQEDREVAAISRVDSDTSSTQVTMSRDEFSPDESAVAEADQENPKRQPTLSIHNMDDEEAAALEDDAAQTASESRNLRRQRLAKKKNKYGTTTADDHSVGAASAATSMTSVLPNPMQGGKHGMAPAEQQQQTPLSPVSPKIPNGAAMTEEVMANNEGTISPTSPSRRASRLARIMRRAQQNQRDIAAQIAEQPITEDNVYPYGQQPSQQQQHILHQVDGVNAAVAHAARMARSESEVEASVAPQSPPHKMSMLGLSSPTQSQQRVCAGLSPHRQQKHVRGPPNAFPDSISPPSLAAPSPRRPVAQQQQLHYQTPAMNPGTAGPYNPYLQQQQVMQMQQQQQQHYLHLQHQQQQQGSNRLEQRSFHQYKSSPASSHHLRQQQQEQHQAMLLQQQEDPSSGTGSRVSIPPQEQMQQQQYAYHQQYRMSSVATEERSGVDGAISPASMHIASSEWTAAAEDNHIMICGPGSANVLRNVHFVRGGNGLRTACEPLGLKCQSLVSNLVSTCGALTGNVYHTDSKRSQFEKAAQQSISNLAVGFMDHDFSNTIGPHWQNYGAYFSQDTGKSSYQSTYDEDEMDERSDVDEMLAMARKGPKNEFNELDDSFAANAKRLFQRGNDIMGTLPTEFQNLTQSASTGVFGAQGMPGDQGASMVKDVKNLFDTFQRYYEPEEVVYDGKEEFQQGSLNLSQHQPIATPYNSPMYRPYAIPVQAKSGLVGEFHQDIIQDQNAVFPPDQPPIPLSDNLDNEKGMTQENLDVLTGIRRRRHKVFPFNAPSHQDPADDGQKQDEQSTIISKGDPAIDASYDKTRVKRRYRNLTDRIHKDKPEEDAKEESKVLKEEQSPTSDESSPQAYERKEEIVKTQKELNPLKDASFKEEEEQIVEDTAKDLTEGELLADSKHDSENDYEDAFQGSNPPSEHSRSFSRRSEESKQSAMSFDTAHHCGSITRHETAHHLFVAPFEDVERETSPIESPTKGEGEEYVAEDPGALAEKSLYIFEESEHSAVQEEQDSSDQANPSPTPMEVTPSPTPSYMSPSPTPSDESVESLKNEDSRYSPTITEYASLQNNFSIPNQSTTKSLETCNTDDLVSAFLAPAADDESGSEKEDEDPTLTEESVESSPQSPAEPNNEQLATTSINSMSDSLVGSDMSEGSPDEMASFEESPMGFAHYHSMVELNEENADQFAMDDPTMLQSSSSSSSCYERTEFPHTPLDVIEEEASNAEELDSIAQLQRFPSSEFQRSGFSEDEDADIFSLQQNTATQDSLSVDETDVDYYTEDAVMQREGAAVATTAAERSSGLSKKSSGVATANVVLKLVFSVIMIYYIGFIFHVWDHAEVILRRAARDSRFSAGPPVNAPSKRKSVTSPPSSAEEWQVLNRLVEDALKSPATSEEKATTTSVPSAVPSRIPQNEWEQELEEALVDEGLLSRVKNMLAHDRRHGPLVDNDDDGDVDLEDQDLEQELLELRKSRQTRSDNDHDEDDE